MAAIVYGYPVYGYSDLNTTYYRKMTFGKVSSW